MADPQVNPNALGAPTEGFGQTVSFAFDPRGVTPSLSLPKSEPRSAGFSGVSHGTGTDPSVAMQPVKPDGTAAFLQSVGAEILGPMIEKERNAKFMQGVQRAMQGDAVKDIAREQPWYSRIFGDTPMLEGARAYEAHAKVNQIVADQTANIENIKHLNADDAAKHFANVMQQSMTGDSSTDMLINKGLIDAMPGLMKAQAKSYYAYGQKRAADAMSSNIATGATSLQQAAQLYAEDKISKEDWALRQQQFVESIMPPNGINEETYRKTVAANLKGMAAKGQFHAIEAVRASGGFAALSAEESNSVEAAIQAAGKTHRNQYAFNYIRQIEELKSDASHPVEGVTTPHSIVERAKLMNEAYTKVSGNPMGLFSSDEIADMAAGTANAIKVQQTRAAELAAKAVETARTTADKAAAQAELASITQRLIVDGQITYATHLPGVSKEQVDLTFMQMFKSNPKSGLDLVRKGFVESGYVNPLIKEQLVAPFRGSENQDIPPDAWRRALEGYKAMRDGTGGQPLASAYYGDYAPKMERYLTLAGSAPDGSMDNVAYRAAMGLDGQARPQPLDKKQRADLAAQVASRTSGLLPKWLGGYGLRPESVNYLADLAAPTAEQWRGVPGVDDATAMANGIGAVLSGRKVETLGGYVIDRATADPKVSTLRELASGTKNIPTDKVDDYFKAFLTSKHVGDGTVRINYAGDNGWNHQFIGTVMQPDGKAYTIRFTANEWAKFAGEHAAKDTAPSPNAWYQAGTKINGGYPAGPSPYATDSQRAEWYAKRDAEARKRAQQATN